MTCSVTTQAARVVVFSLAATLAGGTASAATRRDQSGDVRRPLGARVRGADEKARSLMQKGASRSATFRALLEALDRSDVVVYVQTVSLDRPSALLFVSATSHMRYLRILVRSSGRPDDELIAWLGHELRHAVEIAAAPDVRDDNGVLRLFRRIGFTSRATCETNEAEQVWRRVLDEVRYGTR